MGVGEGIGSDGPGGGRTGGGRRRERGGSAYWWVLVLVLSEQTTAWFSLSFFPPFGVFGWVLFGYVLCLPPPFSLFFLSPLRKGMERPSSKLREGQADLLTCGLFILSPPADPSPSVVLTHFYPHLPLSLSSPSPSHQNNPNKIKSNRHLFFLPTCCCLHQNFSRGTNYIISRDNHGPPHY